MQLAVDFGTVDALFSLRYGPIQITTNYCFDRYSITQIIQLILFNGFNSGTVNFEINLKQYLILLIHDRIIQSPQSVCV